MATVNPMPPRNPPAVQTVALVSLGCPKNLVDSEKMLGLLAEDGLMPVSDEADADAIVINTCGFLEASRDESVEVIREAVRLKQAGQLQRVVVAGCLVQRHRAKLLEWCPDVDALIGVYDRDAVVAAVRGNPGTRADLGVDVPVYSSIAGSAAIKRQRDRIDAAGYYESDAARLRLTPRHWTYLRMSEGCNQNCAFCTIPSIRGKMRSKPIPSLLAEAAELLADGAFELNLIGQDTTSYGRDIGYAPGLPGMLVELDQLAASHGGAWLRLMYAYPSQFTDAMVDAIAALPNVVKYIDMPLQHINDRVLEAMRRRTSRRQIETLLHKLRDRVPGIALRTTFITGFPGETPEEHAELLAFVRDFGFDAMGVFAFSPEPGTPAARLHADCPVPQERVEAQLDELMLAQQQVAFARNQAMADQKRQTDVLIDGPAESAQLAADDDDATLYVGRTPGQAPEVDAVTYVASTDELCPGELADCTIVDSHHYDLIARPTRELSGNVSLPLAQ